MGILKIAIYDNDISRMCDIENVIKFIAYNKNWKQFSIMKISSLQSKEKILSYAESCQLLFASLDTEAATDFAAQVYRKNVFCKTVFYNYNENIDINQILLSRPVACIDDSNQTERIISLMENELSSNDKMLFLENKKIQIFLPVDKIIYFSSREHYVNVVYADNSENARFNKKLDEIQMILNDRLFVRIHKSYLVSALHIVSIDKKSHMMKMDNDKILPISDSYYKSTIEKLRQICLLKP